MRAQVDIARGVLALARKSKVSSAVIRTAAGPFASSCPASVPAGTTSHA